MIKLLIQCPHCGVKDQLAQGGQAVGGWEGATNWLFRHCNNPHCRKPLFVVYDNNEVDKTGEAKFIYPVGGGNIDRNTKLPSGVREEFDEAYRCLQVDSFLASMTMSRRVLQRCLKDLGFSQRNLYKQIDAAKDQNIIPKRYHKLADEVRYYGNVGAHPDDDKLHLANEQNAKFLLEFVKLLVEEFYVVHQRVELLSNARNQE